MDFGKKPCTGLLGIKLISLQNKYSHGIHVCDFLLANLAVVQFQLVGLTTTYAISAYHH
jgi:hypothetical protein